MASGSGDGGALLNVKNFPNGAYKLTGCILKSDGTCEATLKDTAYFVVYDHAWEEGKMFVFANGPEFGDLNSSTKLQLVDPSQGVTTESYPGLLVINLNGATQDLRVTDGKKTRTFTPDREVSRFVFFTDRDQPYLYAVSNGASFAPGAVVPGSIATLFSWGGTHEDPRQSGTLPLPKWCGNAKAVFSSDSMTVEAPFFYCSQTQFNVQVPNSLAGLQSVQAKIVLNNTASNTITLAVREADPGIVVVDWPNKTGAVIFPDGQIVNNDHPASVGDSLSLYATGLGAVDPPQPPDGSPAPDSPLSTTIAAPVATLDGISCPVSFSGLAPGYVGLYQLNFTVPEGLEAGTHGLVLSVNGAQSNTVKLFLR